MGTPPVPRFRRWDAAGTAGSHGGATARVLIPISEPIGGAMSAVGIRQLEVGKVLARHCAVTFASTAHGNDGLEFADVVDCHSRGQFRKMLATHDVLYTLGLNWDRFSDVVGSPIRVVLDLYTPIAIEMLESWPEVPTELLGRLHRRIVRWTIAQLGLADFVVCASEPQRDFWIGTMNAVGRWNSRSSRSDPTGRRTIGVVPFGLPDEPPREAGHPLRARLPRLGTDDFILLWSSKVLAWQDPATLLRAMSLLRRDEPKLKLVFLGTGTPSPRGAGAMYDPASFRTREALELSAALHLTDETVFFLADRIDYREIGSFYRDANAAIATYPDTLETRYCVGSRLLDYVWAGLPMVVSGVQLQRDFVEEQGLGLVVAPGDPDALAGAIRQLKDEVSSGSHRTKAFALARERLRWSALCAPIVEYCLSGGRRQPRSLPEIIAARLSLVEFLARTMSTRVSQFRSKVGWAR